VEITANFRTHAPNIHNAIYCFFLTLNTYLQIQTWRKGKS
jgi:hypothetical protein